MRRAYRTRSSTIDMSALEEWVDPVAVGGEDVIHTMRSDEKGEENHDLLYEVLTKSSSREVRVLIG